MKMIALKTFRNRKLGLVRGGRNPQEFEVDDSLGKDLERAGLAVPVGKPAPEKAATAPETKASPSQAGGGDVTLSASLPARASRQTTVQKPRRGRPPKKTDA